MSTKLKSFKRGDTATFRFSFTDPYSGFNWAAITLDAAMTDIAAPNDNSGAAATRIAQPLTVQTGGAYYEFTLTPAEAKSLTPDTEYNVEVQLKQGGTVVVTPATAKVKILQDYVI